jgi:hypothetical protein
MKALTASLLTLALAAMPLMASTADEKQLQNLKGTVTYGPQQTPTTQLAHNAVQPLNDADYVATGADSQAAITLPDSSRILIGQNSNVQLQSFNQSDIAHAKFLVVGKVRFSIQHPAGAKADYTFQTQTGQIAVRGTDGDLNFTPANNGLQVNVYSLSNPAFPVQVTLANGQVFTLAAGQSLVVTAAAGALVGSVSGLTNTLFQPFTEFGLPANAGPLGIAGAGTGAGAAAGAASTGVASTAAAAAVVGTGVAATAVASSQKNATPSPTPSPTPQPSNSPTPSPQPSTTSVPIVISGKHGTEPSAPPAPAPAILPPGARPGNGHPTPPPTN